MYSTLYFKYTNYYLYRITSQIVPTYQTQICGNGIFHWCHLWSWKGVSIRSHIGVFFNERLVSRPSKIASCPFSIIVVTPSASSLFAKSRYIIHFSLFGYFFWILSQYPVWVAFNHFDSQVCIFRFFIVIYFNRKQEKRIQYLNLLWQKAAVYIFSSLVRLYVLHRENFIRASLPVLWWGFHYDLAIDLD